MVGNTLAYFGMGVSFVPALCVSLHLLDIYGYLLSFSRGAYVASGIYLVGSLLVMHKADKLRIVLSALAALVLVVVCCPKEVQTTLAMNRTASQRQSTESRVQGTSAAWTAFKVCPLVGYGNGNYMYALDTATGQDSTKSFTSMPPNTLARMLVEKGIVGTSLYVLFCSP